MAIRHFYNYYYKENMNITVFNKLVAEVVTLEEGAIAADLLAKKGLTNVKLTKVNGTDGELDLSPADSLTSGDTIRVIQLDGFGGVKPINVKGSYDEYEDEEEDETVEAVVPEQMDGIVGGIFSVTSVIRREAYQLPAGNNLVHLATALGINDYTKKFIVNGVAQPFSYVIQHGDMIELPA